MSGSEHARPVWLDDKRTQSLVDAAFRLHQYGHADIAKALMDIAEERDAAPADPTEAIGLALRDILAPHRFAQRTDLTWDLSRAVLAALGCAKDPA